MRFTVPQFIDIEDKIIGPLSVRQFVTILVTIGFLYLWFKFFNFVPFVLLALATAAIGGVLAFAKVNGQAFHYFLLILLQNLRRPRGRIWNNRDELRALQTLSVASSQEAKISFQPKAPLVRSRLAKLALIVDTGGSFRDPQTRIS